MDLLVRCMNGQCATHTHTHTHTHTNSPSLCVFAIIGSVCFPIVCRSCSGRTTLAPRVCNPPVQPVVRQTPAPLGNLPMSFIPPSRSSSFSSPQLTQIDTSFCEADVPPPGIGKGPLSVIGIWSFHSYKEGSCTGLAVFNLSLPSPVQTIKYFTDAPWPKPIQLNHCSSVVYVLCEGTAYLPVH